MRTQFLAIMSILFLSQTLVTSSALGDELTLRYSGERKANAQQWLSICFLNRSDAKLEASFQFGYNPKPAKWRKLVLPDGGAMLLGQTFLDETEAPKIWVKYDGADADSSWTESAPGTISAHRPKSCEDVQRVAFVEETDGHVTLKVIPVVPDPIP